MYLNKTLHLVLIRVMVSNDIAVFPWSCCWIFVLSSFDFHPTSAPIRSHVIVLHYESSLASYIHGGWCWLMVFVYIYIHVLVHMCMYVHMHVIHVFFQQP
jgi:hypothetical protein